MPIRPELRPLYPANWRELSRHVRFVRARGRCQHCARPHLAELRCLPDGRWLDHDAMLWRDRRGKACRWPDLVEAAQQKRTRVVLAAAHLDGDPANNRLRNLRSLCQRCHVLHDVEQHTKARWLSYRRRWAVGDLFLGSYVGPTCTGAGQAALPRSAGARPNFPSMSQTAPVQRLNHGLRLMAAHEVPALSRRDRAERKRAAPSL